MTAEGCHLVSLGEYGYRGCTGVKPATGFCSRHPLYSMDAALKLEAPIHTVTTDGCAGKFTAALLLCGCYFHHLRDACSANPMQPEPQN